MRQPTGPQLWMLIVNEFQSTSLHHVNDLTEKFNAMTLKNFKGENVREYAVSAEGILIQLERDNQLPCLHLSTIVTVFSNCSVSHFAGYWQSKQWTVEKFITASAGKGPVTIASMPDATTYTEILEEGKQMYANLSKEQGHKGKTDEASAMVAKLNNVEKKLNQALTQKTTTKADDDNKKKK